MNLKKGVLGAPRLLGMVIAVAAIPACLIDPATGQTTSAGSGPASGLSQGELAGSYTGTWTGKGTAPAGDPITFTLDGSGTVTGGTATLTGVGPTPLSGQLLLQNPQTGQISGTLIFDTTPFTIQDMRVLSPGQAGKQFEIKGTTDLNFVLDVSGP